MVSDEPRDVGLACRATIVEKSGESAITDIPQIKRKPVSKMIESVCRKNGDKMQHAPDIVSAAIAVCRVPRFDAINPAATHATLPDAMIRNVIIEIFRSFAWCVVK